MDRRTFIKSSAVSGLVLALNPFKTFAQIGENNLRREIRDLLKNTGVEISYITREKIPGGEEIGGQIITSENVLNTLLPRGDLIVMRDYLKKDWGENKEGYMSRSERLDSLTMLAGSQSMSGIRTTNLHNLYSNSETYF